MVMLMYSVIVIKVKFWQNCIPADACRTSFLNSESDPIGQTLNSENTIVDIYWDTLWIYVIIIRQHRMKMRLIWKH